MSLAIANLLRAAPHDDGAIDRFLRDHEFPLVEGTSATFVFRGRVDAVYLRHWVFGLGSQQPFNRLENSDFWYLTLELPARSRVEYKLEIQQGDHSRWIRDPLNDQIAHDPFGANSVCAGEGYQRPEWTEYDPDARAGTIEEITLPRTPFGGPRRLTVYLPARFRVSRRYRLLVVHDGGDYLRYSSLKEVLDNLIDRLEVAPLIVAMTHPEDRLVEYADDPRHADFIVNTVVPYMEENYPLYKAVSARCLMGASFGGVASLSTAWRYPGAFGRLLLQSGSFAFTDIGENRRGPLFDRVVSFVNGFREAPGRLAEKVFVSCGTYESLIYENRSMVPLLQATGMDIRYEEARDGHNWENWRDRLRTALSWLFPGPLWMVYE